MEVLSVEGPEELSDLWSKNAERKRQKNMKKPLSGD
jgi:hypothetical protein